MENRIYLLLFALALLAEWTYGRLKKRQLFHFSDSLVNIAISLFQFVSLLLFAVAMFGFYDWISRHFAPWHIPANGWTWVLLFVFNDYVGYWRHRLYHKINLLWIAHSTHHQSEEFNLTVGLRSSALVPIQSMFFTGFVALCGFDPAFIVSVNVVQSVYQMAIHTQTIDRLGWLEWIFVTPSHHRAHHGSNPEYVDKNYGETFIIWDRLHGTFEPERREVVFGLIVPVASYQFGDITFYYLKSLLEKAKTLPTWREKWNLWFGQPVKTFESPAFEPDRPKFRPPVSPLWMAYVLTQGGVLLAAVIWFTEHQNGLSMPMKIGLTILLCWGFANLVGLLEHRKRLLVSEFFRLTAVAGLLFFRPDLRAENLFLNGLLATFWLAAIGWLLLLFLQKKERREPSEPRPADGIFS